MAEPHSGLLVQAAEVTAPILQVPAGFFPLSGEKRAQTHTAQTMPAGDNLLSLIKSAWTLHEVCESAGIVLIESKSRPGQMGTRDLSGARGRARKLLD